MRAFILVVFFFLAGNFAKAQSFGIGTDIIDASAILEIKSISKGILISRLTTIERDTNLTGLTITQKGLLIYNTTDDEFNYWDGIQWVSFPSSAGGSDEDWTDAGAVMYPFDGSAQNVSIGNTTSNGKLSVYSNTVEASIYIQNNNTSSSATGIGNYLISATSGGNGLYQEITGGSSAVQLSAIYNDLTNVASTGAGNVTGITNVMSGSGSSAVYGVENILDGSQSGSRYGVYSEISGTGTGTHYGLFNSITSSSVGNKFGIRNDLTSLNTNYAYGNYNRILGAVSTQLYGYFNLINNTGNADVWGNDNAITNTGSGTIYGMRNSVSGSGIGDQYGIYNSIDNTGLGNDKYGTYNSIGSSADGLKYGTYNELYNSNNSVSYGTYNDISSTGAGIKYGTYNYFHTSASGNLYGNYVEMASQVNATKYGNYYRDNTTTLGTQVGNFVSIKSTSSSGKFGYYYQSDGSTNGQQRGYMAAVNGSGSATGLMYGYFSTVLASLGGTTHYGMATGALGPGHYGIYAENTNSGGYAGFFQGNVTVTGTFSNPSDEKFKTKIQPLDTSLDKLMQLEPKSYVFKPDLADIWGFPRDVQTGFIAQELEGVIPNLVQNQKHTPRNLEKEIELDNLGPATEFKSINSIGLIPYIVKAIQEQQVIINEKEETIIELQNRLSDLEKRMLILEGND